MQGMTEMVMRKAGCWTPVSGRNHAERRRETAKCAPHPVADARPHERMSFLPRMATFADATNVV